MSTTAIAQLPQHEWSIGTGGTSDDRGNCITTDANGNVLVTGFFSGIVDFDPGIGISTLTSSGNEDIFIQKLSSNGDLLWVKQMGSTGDDLGQSITSDTAGNVYITGRFRGTVDFDPGAGIFNMTSGGFYDDIFIQKLDENGDFLWAKQFGGPNGDDNSHSINIDTIGNVITIGEFGGTSDFNPGAGIFNLTAIGSWDIFIQKLDNDGNFLWAKQFGGASFKFGYSIAIDENNNIYAIGSFHETVDFDPGAGISNLTANGDQDVFIARLNSEGSLNWVKQIGGSFADVGKSIIIDNNGDVCATGSFRDTVDFNTGTGNTTLVAGLGGEGFVLKIDTSGNFKWVKQIGGGILTLGEAIQSDVNGNIFTTGFFAGTVDFNPGVDTLNLSSVNGTDAYIQKLTMDGKFAWASQIGSQSYDFGRSIAADENGDIYTTGYFALTADFDPGMDTLNISSTGGEDIYIQKLRPCLPIFSIDSVTTCDSLYWIDGNVYTASNNTATHTIINNYGCDSIITLALTLNAVSDLSTTIADSVITANNQNSTYQWLDCDSNYNPIIGENYATYVASNNGNYAVELTENGCIDTSDCVAITTVGIHENTFNDGIHVYPNPTQNKLYLEFEKIQTSISVRVLDFSGKELQLLDLKNTNRFDLELNYPSGLYFLEVLSEQARKSVMKFSII